MSRSLVEGEQGHTDSKITQRCSKRRPQAGSPARYGGSPSRRNGGSPCVGTPGRHDLVCAPHKRTRPSREPHGGCHWRPEQSQQGAALASKVGAIIRPSAFAALTSANLV